MNKIYSSHNNNNSHRSNATQGSAAAAASNSSQGNGGPGGQQAANNVGVAVASAAVVAATTRVGNSGPNSHQAGGALTAAAVAAAAAGPQQQQSTPHHPSAAQQHQHQIHHHSQQQQQSQQQSQANAPAPQQHQQPPTNVPNNSGNNSNNNSSSGNHHGGHHPHQQQQHHHHPQQQHHHHHNQYQHQHHQHHHQQQHHSRQQHGHNLHQNQNQHHHQHHQHQAHHQQQQQQHHHHHSQQQQQHHQQQQHPQHQQLPQHHHHQQQPHHQPQNSAFVPHPAAAHIVHDVIEHQHPHPPHHSHPQPPQQQVPVPQQQPQPQQQQPQQQPPQLPQPQPPQVQQGPAGGPQQPTLPTPAPGQPQQQQPQNQPQQHHNPVVKHHPQPQQAPMPNAPHIHQTQPPHHHPHPQVHPNHHHHNQHLPMHPSQMAVPPSMPPHQWGLGPHPTQTQQSSQAQHHHPHQHLHHPHPHPQQQPQPHHQPPLPQPASQQPQAQQQPPPHHLPHPQAPQMMINQQYQNPNLFYTQMGHTFVPPTGNVPPYDHPPSASHQPDPVNLTPAQQPVSVNSHLPGNLPINQLSTPTVISTSTTGTTNVHLNNEPMMDTLGPNRPMPQINQHSPFMLGPNYGHQFLPMVPYALNAFSGGHMPPSPIMAPIRVPNEYSIRPQHFDSQNPTTPMAALNVPTKYAPMTSAPTQTPVPAKSRPRKPLAIVHPDSKHVYTEDELKSSPANQSITSKDSSSPRISSEESPISEKEPLSEELMVKSPGDAGASKSSDIPADEVKSEIKLTEPEPAKVEPELKPEPKPKPKSEQEVKNEIKAELKLELIRDASPVQVKKPEVIIDERKSSPVIEKKIVENGEVEPKVDVDADLVDKVAAVKISDEVDSHEDEFEDDNESPVTKPTLPNLPYAAGQYSPLNRSGKKKYSIEFLKAVAKELKLDLDTSSNHNQRIDFAPHYVNQNNLRGEFPSSQPLTRRSSQQVITKPRKVIATHSLQQEVELKTAEKPWKPELEEEKSKIVETGEMDTTRLLKVFRGHLNKLTPQKYDSLIEKIGALDLKGPGRLASVIDLVFDKAVDEPGFCELYARMCKVIAAKDNDFCFHLVKKCQEEFETVDLYEGLNVEERKREIGSEKDPAKHKLMSEELYEDMRIRRKKYLGTIKLIGEMYKLGLLIPKIIGLCMSRLIAEASNENIECLCSLIATVGAKMANEQDDAIKQSLKNTLSVIHDFANNKKTNELFILESRIKFKILDTIDLSKRNWRPRMVENNPKKIDEIHQEVKDEIMRQHHHNHSSQSKSSFKPDDRDRDREQRDREREREREREMQRDRENRERSNRRFIYPRK